MEINGMNIGIDLLKSVTVYEGNIEASDRNVIHFFWQIMSEFTPSQKEQFLKFTWARTRMPQRKSDFGGNTFKIQACTSIAKDPDTMLPKSHTCFFSLQLPPYSSAAVMKEKFLYAFKNTASMDEVTLQDSELYNYEADDL